MGQIMTYMNYIDKIYNKNIKEQLKELQLENIS